MYISKRYIKHITLSILVLIIFFILTFILDFFDSKSETAYNDNDVELVRLRSRIESLEPTNPINISSIPINSLSYPSKTVDIEDIIENGEKLSINNVYTNKNFKRPSYASYWHSTISDGRWSYVPLRIEFSYHKIFTTYPTSSIYYDFLHNLGLWNERESIKLENSLNNILLVVFQSKVKEIISYGNQMAVIVEPTREGVEVISIPSNKIYPFDKKDPILFQLFTPDGYELDYSLIKLIND